MCIKLIRTHLHCKNTKEAIAPHVPQDLEMPQCNKSLYHNCHTKGPELYESISVFIAESLLSSHNSQECNIKSGNSVNRCHGMQ